jgi:hypothetical protein
LSQHFYYAYPKVWAFPASSHSFWGHLCRKEYAVSQGHAQREFIQENTDTALVKLKSVHTEEFRYPKHSNYRIILILFSLCVCVCVVCVSSTGSWTQALCLPCKHCTTWATPPALSVLVIFEIGFWFIPGWSGLWSFYLCFSL